MMDFFFFFFFERSKSFQGYIIMPPPSLSTYLPYLGTLGISALFNLLPTMEKGNWQLISSTCSLKAAVA